MEAHKAYTEALEYFQSRSVYEKLFQRLKEKYESLGKMGGTVVLTDLTLEEKNQLSGFFQKDYTEKEKVSISCSAMEKALENSRFSGVSVEALLTGYFGAPLCSKRELRSQEQEEKEQYFQGLLQNTASSEAKGWLQRVLTEKKEGYLLFMQQYREDRDALSVLWQQVEQAIFALPVVKNKEQKELLAVFAARITGDPHAFDEGTRGEKLLSAFLRSYLDVQEETKDFGAEYKGRLFYEAGILRDPMSRDVLAYGIRGWKRDGELHPGLEGFWQSGEPVKMTLQTLSGLGQAASAFPEAQEVYVVENPAVFSVLVEKYPRRACLCGNGQVNQAVLALMDLLAGTGILYYAGDFDPEGLLIAQRLKKRYGQGLRLWNYRVDWYETYLSEVRLDDVRLKKLAQVCQTELLPLKEAMCRERRAAYQEAMLEVME